MIRIDGLSQPISIHAPLAGRDLIEGDGDLVLNKISIHAPLAGRDHIGETIK